jgi:uncharacterized membrane protein required for colicin V production
MKETNRRKEPTTGGERVVAIFFRHGHKSVREQADMMLFVAGLAVEYVLLFAVFGHYASTVPSSISKVVAYSVTASLVFALAVHQFLIFRNYSLHYSLSQNRLRPLERIICLMFGVLTGELGYLVILAICSRPQWLKDVGSVFRFVFGLAGIACFVVAVRYVMERRQWALWKRRSTWFICGALVSLGVGCVFAYYADPNHFVITSSPNGLQWYFAEQALKFDVPSSVAELDFSVIATDTISWFAHALGLGLKAIFAFGAAMLSLMILIWDILAERNFEESRSSDEGGVPVDEIKVDVGPLPAEQGGQHKVADERVIAESYKTVKKLFYLMDGLAFFTWTAVLGVVVPKGLFGTSPQEWCGILAVLSSLYAGSAIARLYYAKGTLDRLSSWEIAKVTVI